MIMVMILTIEPKCIVVADRGQWSISSTASIEWIYKLRSSSQIYSIFSRPIKCSDLGCSMLITHISSSLNLFIIMLNVQSHCVEISSNFFKLNPTLPATWFIVRHSIVWSLDCWTFPLRDFQQKPKEVITHHFWKCCIGIGPMNLYIFMGQ